MDLSKAVALKTLPLTIESDTVPTRWEPGLLLFRLAILTMLVQAVVVSTTVKGLVPAFLLVLCQFCLDGTGALVGRSQRNILRSLVFFLFVFAAWQSLSQVLNVFWSPDLHRGELVSPEDPSVVLVRQSLLTQSLYLVTCVIFYLYLRQHLARHDSADQLLRLARIGVLIFTAYGFYEVIGYAVFHQNVDFLSNRITGNHGGSYSNFQRLALGDIELVRMKSLASEASMFAFSLLPFLILYWYQKDRVWILLLAAILISTSTTAYLGLLTFFVAEALLYNRWRKLAIALGVVVFAWLYLQTTALGNLMGFIIDKLMLENTSGVTRSSLFGNSMYIFGHADVLHQLFGHGFGYIRSTDGISTLLVNVGILGLGVFLWFTLYPLFRMTCNTEYRKALLLAGIVMIITSLVSVSEFYFFQTWFFAALSWHEWSMDKRRMRAAVVGSNMRTAEADPRAVIVG